MSDLLVDIADEVRPRVAAYVVRPAGDGMELLVFDHENSPEAGTQVPAGGIRPTESRKEAVLREVKEETGLENVRVVTELGIVESPHPVSGQPRRTSYWALEVEDDLPSGWRHEVSSNDGHDGDGASGGDGGGDDGMVFVFRWELLPLEVALADDQGSLLAQLPRILG